jgi:NADH-quinone oxidoreductase subunit H
MVTVSAMATTLFLGGGTLPFLDLNGWLEFVVFIVKTFIFLFVFIWLRGTLPRLRYDQFMRFGWKVLIPLNLIWILALAGIRVAQGRGGAATWIAAVAVAVVLLALIVFWPSRTRNAENEEAPAVDPRGRIGGKDGFPLPPLNLEVPPSPRAKRILVEREPVPTGKEN